MYLNAICDPSDYDSEYLCKQCGGLLYVINENGSDVCINESCKSFPDFQFHDPSEAGSPELHHQLFSIQTALISKIKKCDPVLLAKYAFDKRKRMITASMQFGEAASIPDFLSLGELLMMLNTYPPAGHITNSAFFELICQESKRLVEYLNFIDGIGENRYLLVKAPSSVKIIQMKYLSVVHDMHKSYGLASSATPDDISELFQFEDIQAMTTQDVEPGPAIDFADYFDGMWPFVIALRYLLSLNYRTSKHYNYDCVAEDLAALLSFSESLSDNETRAVSLSNVERHYNIQPRAPKPFQRFFDKYIGSQDKVPIFVQAGGNVLMDRSTLLFFMMYLHGHYEVSGSDKRVRSPRIQQKKADTGIAFEAYLRSKMSERGFTGPDESVITKSFEYDILMASAAQQRIVLIEAKFQDPSPSSISAHTLIKQELLVPTQGLLPIAQRQMDRLDYFNHNKAEFKQYFNSSDGWENYDIEAYVITKHSPILSRYKQVKIISVADLLKSEL